MIERIKKWRLRRGTNLVELLGVMAVIIIIAAITVGGITAARDNANETSVNSDLRTYQIALQQVFVQNPEVMKYTSAGNPNAVKQLVEFINAQLEQDWRFEAPATPNTGSGGVAGTAIKRDAWDNPYGLYIYFDDKADTYTDVAGNKLKNSDSCIYIAVVSAGKNGTGGPVGSDGFNFDQSTRTVNSAAAMVNNTDGVDDMGVIVRSLNGDVRTATFGLNESTLGALEDVHWIFGIPDTSGGVLYSFEDEKKMSGTAAGSLDKYYDETALSRLSGDVVGTWSPAG